MFGDLPDDLKGKLNRSLQAAVFGAVMAGAATAAFICLSVALFLWTMQVYGVLEAWTVIGILFAVVALLAMIVFIVLMRKRPAVPARNSPAASSKWLQDPAVLLAGVQIIRTLGIRRLMPLLIVATVAAGFLLSRLGEEGATGHESVEPAE